MYTVAYPRLSSDDAKFMEDFRQRHDRPYRDVIRAHFTLVFRCDQTAEAEYLSHVEAVASRSPRIHFSCRYAMLGADDKDDTAYVFLVPDEGYSSVSILHDQLYTGPLAPYLRLDIPFTPHITIGTLRDRSEAKRLCDELNKKGIEIAGKVETVTVGVLEANKFRDLRTFDLQH